VDGSIVLDRSGRLLLLFSKVEFHSKIAAFAPAAIKMEPASVIIQEGKSQTFVTGNSPIPTTIWVSNISREAAHTDKRFVGDTHDVKSEIVARVAQTPGKFSGTFSGSIPLGWNRVVGIPEPPDRVQLLTSAELMIGDVGKSG